MYLLSPQMPSTQERTEDLSQKLRKSVSCSENRRNPLDKLLSWVLLALLSDRLSRRQ